MPRQPCPHVVSLLAALTLIAAPASGSAQESDQEWLEDCRAENGNRRDNAVHCEVRPVEVGTTGSLGITGGNGPIRVSGDAVRAVTMRARLQVYGGTEAEAREAASRVRIVVDGDRVSARAPRGVDYAVGFIARVPREYDLDLRLANGPLTLEDVRGRIAVEMANGPAELDNVGGDITASSANGPLTVDISDGALGSIDVETVNGPLTLRLPAGVNARLVARTGNGPLSTSGLDVEVDRPEYGPGGSIDATLGTGGPTIRARTANGPLSIRAGR